MPSKTRNLARIAALVAVSAVTVAGCSSGGSGKTEAADSSSASSGGVCGTSETTTLTIGLFGTFGYKENGLYDQYKKRCPNITINENDVEQSADYWTKLKTRLASGSGLDDIQGIEIGFVADVVQNHAKQFVNFNTLPDAAALKSSFYDWKWKQATTTDSKVTIGLGTDAGPEAICYRPDLLTKAGLSADPATLAQLWSTWDGFIKFGQQYQASATKQADSTFLDSAASLFSTAVYQGKEAYNDESGKPDVKNSDGVQTAWKYATDAAQAKITAGLQQFTDGWNKAFSSGSFAALACPTWMMGYIQGQDKDGSGHWNIAPVVPGGPTNWGGAWLGVPTAGKHRAATIALTEWLTGKEQQVTQWTSAAQGGHWPSNSTAAKDPAVQGATSAYFSNAPVGTIFSGIADKMTIPPIGLYDTQIQHLFTTQLTNVETKGTSPTMAFKDALDQISQVTG
jgi:cellobiose transport system substrate-binding protein